MKRDQKVFDAVAAEMLMQICSLKTKSMSLFTPFSSILLSLGHNFIKVISGQTHNCCSDGISKSISLLMEKNTSLYLMGEKNLTQVVSELTNELTSHIGDSEKTYAILEANNSFFIRSYCKGSTFFELLEQLGSLPQLALEVPFFSFQIFLKPLKMFYCR
ncbi:hypothetical protein NE237_015856 [Protea cynaroides]|uniref:Uncharacterized protein n=1 Tax=Protea cynaroides TaxID=273540 RepID=A0A9Q0KEU4_9MAGN|nr:hypothetical protein NE237_015856 [Protea cynaroides]